MLHNGDPYARIHWSWADIGLHGARSSHHGIGGALLEDPSSMDCGRAHNGNKRDELGEFHFDDGNRKVFLQSVVRYCTLPSFDGDVKALYTFEREVFISKRTMQ